MPRRKNRGLQAARHLPPGTPPGTLTVRPGSHPSRLEVAGFGPNQELFETTLSGPAELTALRRDHAVVWVHVTGLADVERLAALGTVAGIHPLAMEDVVSSRPRPKAEMYNENLFLTLSTVGGGDVANGPNIEPLSIFVSPGLLVTFCDNDAEWIAPIRARMRAPGSPMRERGADWLAYTVVDAVTDHYFPLLEKYGALLEEIEERVTTSGSRDLLGQIMALRHDLVAVQRIAWPLREALHMAVRDAGTLVEDRTRLYLRDCQEHVVQVLDLVEAYRDLAASLMDVHLTALEHRNNEVMKLLTIIATIFMPLSFLASLYGMNFDRASPFNQPELGWRFGYLALIGLMLFVALGLVVFFYRRGWLGTDYDRK